MGMRFRKSVKICKGVKVNFSKSGASLSLGGRGHSMNFGGRGTRATFGIPGTGLSYSTSRRLPQITLIIEQKLGISFRIKKQCCGSSEFSSAEDEPGWES